jgi:leukotriene-A4 hydrolase
MKSRTGPARASSGALALLALCACYSVPRERRPSFPMDIHSHAEPARVRVTHASLDLEIDPARSELRGSVVLSLDRADHESPLVLDAKGLAVESVTGTDGGARNWSLGPEDAILGSALTVELLWADKTVRIAYRTTERAEALQWLAPGQTADREAPFLFTQGQSILTRTWIPVQDSPGIRITFDARVRAPQGLTVLMSAEMVGPDAGGAFRFRMDRPIPPYLIALACGKLEFRPISPRCGIWAEPSVVDRARDEFADTEKMIEAAEGLFGPYRWGRYDVLVLPPSFPFGGMENPCLTFATPTVLAGDRSLVALVAHELAHSWSGNLVTNATWSDFWLNEGFTVYFESRIMERVYGGERARMEAILLIADLEREMKELDARDQILHVDLAGRHPDDGFSQVPYVKGALFLRRVEDVFGRGRFDRFLRSYFDSHAFQSITTGQFLDFLKENLFTQDPELAAQIDLHRWIEEPGLPDDAPRPTSKALADVDVQIRRWKEGTEPAALATREWVTQQWLHFLERIAGALDAGSMAKLDETFHFTDSGNAEILTVWLRLSIAHGYGAADARLEQFLTTVGRRKFLEPLYKELVKTDTGRARAEAIYARARPRYHAVSTAAIDPIVGTKP